MNNSGGCMRAWRRINWGTEGTAGSRISWESARTRWRAAARTSSPTKCNGKECVRKEGAESRWKKNARSNRMHRRLAEARNGRRSHVPSEMDAQDDRKNRPAIAAARYPSLCQDGEPVALRHGLLLAR